MFYLLRSFTSMKKVTLGITFLLIFQNISCLKRNVLLLLADDGGFETSVYNNKICQTPNINALARKSLIFNNAYSAVSSCSPSRSAILTGRPNHENGMYGLHQGVHHFNSFDSVTSLPEILRKNGIRSGIVGKKHVGPKNSYRFDYEQTEENNSIFQVGRNITKIKLLVREFLSQNSTQPFFLYVGFHDPHRCGHTNPEYGAFCEKFGNGYPENGYIPDWVPIYYQHDQIQLPFFVPDTLAARQDVSAQYTAISRLDQGIGLVLKELERSGVLPNTLVIYTSDNGIPFPSGRTNLYDPGIAQPLFISSPKKSDRRNDVTYAMTSHLDLVPTILDWYGISDETTATLTGRSLLPILKNEPENENRSIFASHTHHEITMYYPMRAVRTKRYKLIHNINHRAPFPIDQDFYLSPTFQDILNRTRKSKPIAWNRKLEQYYFREEWELFDLKQDPEELNNLAGKEEMINVFNELKHELFDWLNKTRDPWICSPHGVLEDKGFYKNEPRCLPLLNDYHN